MKKLLIYLDEDLHEDLKELAHRKRTSMSELVRYALDATFEDALDVIGAERSFQEYLADPSSAITLDEFLEKHGIALPNSSPSSGRPRDGETATARQGTSGRGTAKVG